MTVPEVLRSFSGASQELLRSFSGASGIYFYLYRIKQS
jgi:hypothetical protein